MSLTPNFLKLLGNSSATGLGGGCAGDSGGPRFWSAEGAGSNLVVAITAAGDPACRSLEENQRLDTPAVQDFLSSYLP